MEWKRSLPQKHGTRPRARGAGGVAFGVAFGERIPVLELEGVILDDNDFLEQLRRFRRDASVRGFVLAINSPVRNPSATPRLPSAFPPKSQQ